VFNKAYRMNRRRLKGLRVIAILAGFACVIHFTHRECARNADRPWLCSVSANADASDAGSAMEPHAEKFHATAYSVTGLMTSGVPVAPGYVAADPRVIPLGSMIYVETPFMSGIYQVMDTGELIKGKIIDIFIPSYEACKDFGRRIVKVKVLRYGFQDEPGDKGNKATS
jgi:3D (Asp-Asp-Asp) domain-containing protein